MPETFEVGTCVTDENGKKIAAGDGYEASPEGAQEGTKVTKAGYIKSFVNVDMAFPENVQGFIDKYSEKTIYKELLARFVRLDQDFRRRELATALNSGTAEVVTEITDEIAANIRALVFDPAKRGTRAARGTSIGRAVKAIKEKGDVTAAMSAFTELRNSVIAMVQADPSQAEDPTVLTMAENALGKDFVKELKAVAKQALAEAA